MPPGYGAPPYGAAPYAPPPGYAVQPPPQRPPQTPPPVRTAQTPPKPTAVRGQAPDAAPPAVAPAPVAMPSPEQLGVPGRPVDGGCDWTAIHRRVQELGVLSFQMDRLNGDVFQCTCLLPTAEAGRTHRIEAHGATQAEAVRRALDEVQRWRDPGR